MCTHVYALVASAATFLHLPLLSGGKLKNKFSFGGAIRAVICVCSGRDLSMKTSGVYTTYVGKRFL